MNSLSRSLAAATELGVPPPPHPHPPPDPLRLGVVCVVALPAGCTTLPTVCARGKRCVTGSNTGGEKTRDHLHCCNPPINARCRCRVCVAHVDLLPNLLYTHPNTGRYLHPNTGRGERDLCWKADVTVTVTHFLEIRTYAGVRWGATTPRSVNKKSPHVARL
jgi:hypothetical protein